MNIVTKIFLIIDMFYGILFPYVLYVCSRYYNNDPELMWKNQPPVYLTLTSWGIIIIMLQIIYFPVLFLITGKL